MRSTLKVDKSATDEEVGKLADLIELDSPKEAAGLTLEVLAAAVAMGTPGFIRHVQRRLGEALSSAPRAVDPDEEWRGLREQTAQELQELEVSLGVVAKRWTAADVPAAVKELKKDNAAARHRQPPEPPFLVSHVDGALASVSLSGMNTYLARKGVQRMADVPPCKFTGSLGGPMKD